MEGNYRKIDRYEEKKYLYSGFEYFLKIQNVVE